MKQRLIQEAIGWGLAIVGAALVGCSTEPPPLTGPKEQDIETAKPSYWLDKPAAVSVFCDDYDKLWTACGDTARVELFTLDRQDYREGELTTQPLISKQIFEPWRPDTGDFYSAMQNTLQTIRRTIAFEFEKIPGGYTVTPKVLVERLYMRPNRITNPTQAPGSFTAGEPTGVLGGNAENATPYWYAIGRDLAMESQLAQSIKQRIGS
ncbi:MAG: hypothetical protein ABSH22_20730 [Tepidisphaeraceae bacterium]|jgi:hypothetical protein